MIFTCPDSAFVPCEERIQQRVLAKWACKIFKIGTRFRREGVPVYTILDWDGDLVEGIFYEAELQPVTIDPTMEYQVERY